MATDIDEREVRKAIQAYETALVRLQVETDLLQEKISCALNQDSQARTDEPNLSGIFWPLSKGLSLLGPRKGSPHQTLQSISKERKEIEQQLLLHKRLISSARLVPPEIWSEIFLLCRPESEDEFVRWGTVEDPRRLAAVCKQWQGIIHTTPQLWSSLSLHVLQSHIAAQQDLLRLWMERTRAAPVSLELIWYPKVKAGVPDENGKWFIDNVYDIISPSAFRWQRLSLCLPGVCIMHILAERMPQLAHLSMTTSVTEQSPYPTLTSSRAPALNSFSIPGVYKHPLSFGMPWSQFTSLRSHYPLNLPDASQFLALCTNLQHCRIRISGVEHIAAQTPLVVPKMLSFALLFKPTEPIEAILDSFTFPNLLELDIWGTAAVVYGRWFPRDKVISLLKRSRCTITTLRGRGLNVPEDTDMFFIENIPTLTKLDITGRAGDILTRQARRVLESRNGPSESGVLTREGDQSWIVVPNVGCSTKLMY